MKHAVWILLGLWGSGVAAASPAIPPTPIDRVLIESASPEELRGRLLERARTEALDREAAGESYYLRGVSLERSGMRDSALADYARATEIRGRFEERFAWIDVLLSRRGPGDVEQALGLAESGRAKASEAHEARGYSCRHAWALTLAGRADSATREFAPLARTLSQLPAWRYRMARAALEAGDARTAYTLLVPLAVASRGMDRDVKALLDRAAEAMGVTRHVDAQMTRHLSERDRIEQAVIDRMGGRRVKFVASDGFPLGGVVVAPAASPARRAAVVLVTPGDTLADYDSLAIALKRAGCAVLLLQGRGSGWSVAAACPSPDTWSGREEQLERLCARDMVLALRVLAAEVPADTSAYLVAGVGKGAPIAVRAAELDRRARAMLLVSPRPAEVERGAMRARMARLKLPVYFLSGAEDWSHSPVTDALYEASVRGESRVAESHSAGTGGRVFYFEPDLVDHFIHWLEATLPPSASRSTPRSTRKRG